MSTETAASIDLALLDTRAAFYAAVEAGDLDAAAKTYARIDQLLEQRVQLPLQRTPA